MTTKRKPGRPATMEKGKPSIVYISEPDMETAMQLGCGNRSLGIRIALQHARERMTPKTTGSVHPVDAADFM